MDSESSISEMNMIVHDSDLFEMLAYAPAPYSLTRSAFFPPPPPPPPANTNTRLSQRKAEFEAEQAANARRTALTAARAAAAAGRHANEHLANLLSSIHEERAGVIAEILATLEREEGVQRRAVAAVHAEWTNSVFDEVQRRAKVILEATSPQERTRRNCQRARGVPVPSPPPISTQKLADPFRKARADCGVDEKLVPKPMMDPAVWSSREMKHQDRGKRQTEFARQLRQRPPPIVSHDESK